LPDESAVGLGELGFVIPLVECLNRARLKRNEQGKRRECGDRNNLTAHGEYLLS